MPLSCPKSAPLTHSLAHTLLTHKVARMRCLELSRTLLAPTVDKEKPTPSSTRRPFNCLPDTLFLGQEHCVTKPEAARSGGVRWRHHQWLRKYFGQPEVCPSREGEEAGRGRGGTTQLRCQMMMSVTTHGGAEAISPPNLPPRARSGALRRHPRPQSMPQHPSRQRQNEAPVQRDSHGPEAANGRRNRRRPRRATPKAIPMGCSFGSNAPLRSRFCNTLVAPIAKESPYLHQLVAPASVLLSKDRSPQKCVCHDCQPTARGAMAVVEWTHGQQRGWISIPELCDVPQGRQCMLHQATVIAVLQFPAFQMLLLLPAALEPLHLLNATPK